MFTSKIYLNYSLLVVNGGRKEIDENSHVEISRNVTHRFNTLKIGEIMFTMYYECFIQLF